jgi:hypothetical protein
MTVEPLMKLETYKNLMATRRSYLANFPSNEPPAYPFVPVFGTGSHLPYRFLLIGQATWGWQDELIHGNFDGSANEAKKVLEDSLAKSQQPFFCFARKFICGTLDLLGHKYDVGELYKIVAYSNLAKIGKAPPYPTRSTNPSGPLLREQSAQCAEQLQYEVNQYRPDIILVTTTKFAVDEILFPALGSSWPHLKHTPHVQVQVLNSDDIGIPALWTNYPNAGLVSKGEKERSVLDPITNIAAAFLRQ